MGVRSLISLFLLALPVGVTLGILLSWDRIREAQGLEPIFVDNSAETITYCQRSYGISPGSVGQRYTLNPNQWGWTPGTPGHLCMNVTSFANDTYATKHSAPPWSVTWQYPPGSEDQPVHAFPNIALEGSAAFPSTVDRIRSLGVQVKWTYSVGLTASKRLHPSALTKANLNANVAIDMFLDPDQSKAQQTTGAKYEVMVWLGQFGPATLPIGNQRPITTTRVVNTTTFGLYYGQNSLGQEVLTWVAQSPADDFVGDITPLLQGLDEWDGPSATDYLGYMGLGSETLYSDKYVTFDVPSLAIDVKTQ